MDKKRALRNQTLTLSEEEQEKYLAQCLKPTEKLSVERIKNRTLLGNTLDILPLLPENCVDLLFVDPPYNLSKKFGDHTFKKTDEAQYEDYTRTWLKALLHTLKDTASIYVCCDFRSGLVIVKVLEEFFTIQNRITWQREKGRGAKQNWKNGMEDIWFATNSKNYTFHVNAVKLRRKVLAPYRVGGAPKDWEETEGGNFRDTHPSNFWDDISIPFWSMSENTSHPTQKPEKLLAKLILASSNPKDLVLDPFLGSGTTSVVAKKLGRHYVGIEMEEAYCATAEKRLGLVESHPEIQGYKQGIFWERNSGK